MKPRNRHQLQAIQHSGAGKHQDKIGCPECGSRKEQRLTTLQDGTIFCETCQEELDRHD